MRRYDVDGAHIDDYFYPYPVPLSSNLTVGGSARPGDTPDSLGVPRAPREQDFPDEPSWQAYVGSGGTLSRADWRRKNVSDLVEQLYATIHREKRWVKFGISPFGVGRPDRRPPRITGFSQYDKLYADVEGWLANGWLDYLAPQLYWRRDREQQAFGALLDYWLRENTRGRHVWPGLYTSRIDDTQRSWDPDEVVGQVALARARGDVRGQLHFSVGSLLQNRKGIADRLRSGPYAGSALVPASPWLDADAPPPPRAAFATRRASDVGTAPGGRSTTLRVSLAPGSDKPVASYAVWARYGADWRFSAVPAQRAELELPGLGLDRVVVSAVDRVGNESRRVRLSGPWAM